MPHYCHLRTDLRCPQCNVLITDLVFFRWGYSPGQLPQEKYIYDLNDPIRWRYCEEARGIFSWVCFKDERGHPEGANFGDPEIRDLIVRDPAQFYWLWDPARRFTCVNCNWPIDGAAIEIRDNRIVRAWVYEPGELYQEVDYYLVEDGGQPVPVSGWSNHLMPSVRGCSEWRLVTPRVENGFLQIPPQ
jgi:hypothetical protein